MMQLLDSLLKQLREKGAQHLMVDGAAILNARQRGAAFAVAAEIMRSDGPLQDDEQNILINLAAVLELDSALSSEILRVMDILHAEI